MTETSGNPSYALFRHIASALEIRDNSDADRDRNLYDAIRCDLGMGKEKPSAFFAAHPEITEMHVLTTFLNILAPFSKMLESIFSLCSRTNRGATGGNDLAIRYDLTADSLRFDTGAFKRYRRVWQMVTATRIQPRYHSDYVPMYPHILQELVRGRTGPRFYRQQPVAPCTVEILSDLLNQARIVGEAHMSLLDDFFSTMGNGTPTEDEVKEWFKDRRIEGMYIPSTPDRVQSWRSSVASGLDTLMTAESVDIFGLRPPQEIAEDAQRLKECIDEISLVGERASLQEVVEEWLSLPYWKKRWQVYEVWIYAECQRAILDAGGRFNLGPTEELVLHTGAPDNPHGILALRTPWEIELWCEYPLGARRKRALRLDLAFVLRTPQFRMPLHFVECKQRINVSASAMANDASKYLALMPRRTTHFLVNYDSFDSPTVTTTPDNDGRSIMCFGDVRPDEPALTGFRRCIRSLLFCGRSFYILVDTTGSMHSKIQEVAQHCAGLTAIVQPSDTLRLILYGDHGDEYTVKDQIGTSDASNIVDAILTAPLTNGNDVPEALEDALHYVREHIQDSRCNRPQVFVFGDGAAHDVTSCPNGHDFHRELDLLRELGADVTLVACRTELSALGWDKISHATATTLDSHAWL